MPEPATTDTPNPPDGAPGDPPGVRVAAVTAWMEANIPGAEGPLRFDLVAGGRSNFTYRVDDAAGNTFVLRRPPLGHLLPSAHDMGREFRIISALGPTVVPVAPALGMCTDESVADRPFYVMRFVDGHILRYVEDAEAFTEAQRATASESVVDVLADLHALDPDAVGLGQLGKRDGYIERQLKRWHTQFTQSKTREVPLVDEVFERLRASIPEQQAVGIVHGDYRLDNTMVGDDGRIVAVLDWEICTLGDPLADVGLLMVYWPERTDVNLPLGAAATLADGFLSRKAMRDRYAARSPLDLSHLDYYVAFGYWKLACILDGVYTRYKTGGMADDGFDFTTFGEQVHRLSEGAASALETLGSK